MRRVITAALGIVASLTLLLSVYSLNAQELPHKPGLIGGLRRDTDGTLVTVPPEPPAAVPAIPPSSIVPPAVSPTRPPTLPAAPHMEIPSRQPESATSRPPDRIKCPADAVACVEVSAGTGQKQIPVTFAHPFAEGAIPQGIALRAMDQSGQSLPLQMDQPIRHADGSLRHAIFTTLIPAGDASGHRVIALLRGGQSPTGPPVDPLAAMGNRHDVRVDLDVYASQISVVTFGQRSGAPFIKGEMVMLEIGDDPHDRYSVTIDDKTAGNSFEPFMKLAALFVPAINAGGRFYAYKIGEGGGYEKIWITTRDKPGQAFQVRVRYGGKAQITVTLAQALEPRRHFSASSLDALRAAGAKAPRWLSGPVASEVVLSTPFKTTDGTSHPRLAARFYLRAFAGDDIVRTDVVVENDWTYAPSPRNDRYDVTITQDGREVLRTRDLEHYHHARWHRVFWTGATPPDIRHDARALIGSRAVWNYDTSLVVPEQTLAREMDDLRKSDTGLMAPAMLTEYQPMTGGRPDIGPLPRWSALYLISQDRRAKQVMLANADAAATVPIHYRDGKTDAAVSMDDHPFLAVRFGRTANGPDALPPEGYAETPWTPDDAHQPSLAYLPYLVTGDLFYLEELQFWANWNLLAMNPGFREQSKGLLHALQMRGVAWSLRTLGEAAQFTPDGQPLKQYFERHLSRNIGWFLAKVVQANDPEHDPPLHFLPDEAHNDQIAPWQQDFMVVTLGHLADMEVAGSEEFLKWLAQFTVGRWRAEKDGYCHAMGPGYWLKVRLPNGGYVRNWSDLFKANWPAVTTCPTALIEKAYPQSYVDVGRASLAVAASFKVPFAKDEYRRLVQESPELDKTLPDYPNWALVPRE